jgi:hypothetical protein
MFDYGYNYREIKCVEERNCPNYPCNDTYSEGFALSVGFNPTPIHTTFSTHVCNTYHR